jgi:hypothetical protein
MRALFAASCLAAGVITALVPQASAQDLGVPACDKMLKVYETCVIPKAGAAGDQLKATFAQMRTNWQAVAATPDGKKSLEPVCAQATEQLKSQLASFNCSW